jgi:hypothetical protein
MFQIIQYSSIAQKIRFIAGNATRYHSILRNIADLIMKVSQSVFLLSLLLKSQFIKENYVTCCMLNEWCLVLIDV